MIIQCPGCHRDYNIGDHVHPEKMQYKLKCTFCDTHWRIGPKPVSHNHPEHHSKKKHGFVSATTKETQHLQHSQTLSGEHAGYHTDKHHENHHKIDHPAQSHTSHTKPDSPHPPVNHSQPTDQHGYFYHLVHNFSLDWILLLGSISLFIILWIYEGKFLLDLAPSPTLFFSKDSPSSFPTTPSPSPDQSVQITPKASSFFQREGTSDELVLENIQHQFVTRSGQPQLKVTGTIRNPTLKHIIPKDLTLAAWGQCPLNPEDIDDQQLMVRGIKTQPCILQKWVYSFKDLKLEPGATKPFETFSPSRGQIAAQRIDVMWSDTMRARG